MKKPFHIFAKLILLLILTINLISCSKTEYAPIEILGKVNGTLSILKEGKRVFNRKSEIYADSEESLFWSINVRTNKPKVRYVEEIKMSGPTSWSINKKSSDSNYFEFKISDDKTTATITRETEIPNEIIWGLWKFNKDDPKGEISVKIKIEGGVTSDFNWQLK